MQDILLVQMLKDFVCMLVGEKIIAQIIAMTGVLVLVILLVEILGEVGDDAARDIG